MWVFCAGSKRSGSTLQYNIVSKVVEASKSGIRIPFFKTGEFQNIRNKYSNVKGYKVCKTHTLTDDIQKEIENGNAIVFHTYRDIRDVIVSYINKGWITLNQKNIEKVIKDYLREYYEWNTNCKTLYSRKYELFAFNIGEEIRYISDILRIEINESQKIFIENELNINKIKEKQQNVNNKDIESAFNQTFDKNTLIHTNHINDGRHLQFLYNLSGSEIGVIESLAWKWLKDKDYKLYWNEMNTFLSYSQHADDYIGWQLLGKNSNGMVVEVGAFDGCHLSNSYSLEQIGWKSICIEPNPDIFKHLATNRPNAKNINCAIIDNDNIKEIEFFAENIGVLSGCRYDEDDVKRRYNNRGLEYKEPRKIIVKAMTLNKILDNLNLRDNKIDILSIDVEGYELEVLKGLDINKYKIGLFIIEANDKKYKEAILKVFQGSNEYIHIGDNYQNLFIIRKDRLIKRNIRKLDYVNYFKAKQFHPIDSSMAIDSVLPNFIKTPACLKYQKYFGIF